MSPWLSVVQFTASLEQAYLLYRNETFYLAVTLEVPTLVPEFASAPPGALIIDVDRG